MTIQEKLFKDKNKIINLLKMGASTVEISKQYNCNPGTVWFFMKNNGLECNSTRSKNYGNDKEVKQKIINLYVSGNSAYRISKLLNISKATILRRLKKWGFSDQLSKNRKRNDDNLLKDKSGQVIKLFKDGHSCQKIAKIVGHSDSNVWRLLKSLGYDTSDWKYFVDEEFFKSIDSEEKAYILGWMYSDGNVMPDGKFRISLHEKDKEILEKIKDILQYKGPLYYNKRDQQWELCINRKSMADDLNSLGCYPNKRRTLRLPTSNQVPEHLFHHFLRGYFDGDGSIRVVNSKIKYVNIVGSYNFIYSLSEKLPFEHKIYQRYKERSPKESSHQMFFLKQAYSQKFLEYLYKDATIYLARKYKIVETFIKV